MFNYALDELCVYHLEDSETFGPDTVKITLISNDWGVLNLLVAECLKVEQFMGLQCRKENVSGERGPHCSWL